MEPKLCEICNEPVKYMRAHMRRAHPQGELLSSAPAAPKGDAPSSVKFVSVKLPSMHLVVTPTQYRVIATPAGEQSIRVEGKSVDFVNGEYETADPEIIDYLENKYNDRRFPVLSMRKAHESLSIANRRSPAFKR